MWPYPWTHVGTPSHLGHMDRVAATMPSQAHAGAAQEAPDIGQWEGQDVPLVRPSSCNVKGGIPSSRRYLPTYLCCCMAPLFVERSVGACRPRLWCLALVVVVCWVGCGCGCVVHLAGFGAVLVRAPPPPPLLERAVFVLAPPLGRACFVGVFGFQFVVL